jgi:transcriptional regulator with XRE-family HTH domain
MESLGSRIALYRNSRRWTQDKLASELGIAQGMLSDIENDKVSPKWDMITKIADQLEIPILNLLPCQATITNNQFSDHSQAQAGTVYNQANLEERKLWEALLKAKEETIEALRKQLEMKSGVN